MTPTRFRWNKRKERAALRLAEATLTTEQIATEAGITRQALHKWNEHPVFRARVEAHVQAFADAIKAKGIAERVNRVEALNDRWRKLHQIAGERGADPAMSAVPGGTSGYLVHQVKQVGAGPGARIVDEYAVDTGLLSELRQHEQQAAKELGQWTDRAEVSGRDGGPIQQAIDHSGAVEVRVVDYRQTAAALQPEVDPEKT